jgi:hypothetical protein
LPPPKKGKTKESTRKSAERDYEAGQSGRKPSPSPRASRPRERVLQWEPHSTASREAPSRQTRRASRDRGAADRHRAGTRAVNTKGKSGLRRAEKRLPKPVPRVALRKHVPAMRTRRDSIQMICTSRSAETSLASPLADCP